MIPLFRLVALLEGISYLLLLFIAVPLKYWGNNDSLVQILGMPHGVLFLGYIALAFSVRPKKKWGVIVFAIILLASLIPFGTFYVDKKYLTKKK